MTQNANNNEITEADQDEMLSAVLQKLSASVQNASPSTPDQAHQAPQSYDSTGNILSALLSNPELISKLPTLLSSIKPIMDMFGGSHGNSAPVSITQPSAVSAQTPTKSSSAADSRTALLYAMKPYLSHDRQNAIDYIIKLGRLGDILKTL